MPVIVDGFIAGVGALVAKRRQPHTGARALLSHQSAERGSAVLLRALDAPGPLLDLGLRLGEGTGAVLACGLVRSAVRTHQRMSPLALAGIVR